MPELDPLLATESYAYVNPISLKGAGAAVPTIVVGGKGVTVTRTAVGVNLFTFVEDPGIFVGFTGPGAFTDTAGAINVAGFSVVAGTYTSGTPSAHPTLVVDIFNASNAAADLATTQGVVLEMLFKKGG